VRSNDYSGYAAAAGDSADPWDPVEDVRWFRKRTQVVLTPTVCLPVSSFWMALYRVFRPERSG